MPATSSGRKLRVTVSSLNVRDKASLTGKIIGSVAEGDRVIWLSSSADDAWLKIQSGRLIGWSSHRYLVPDDSAPPPAGALDEIIHAAGTSAISRYEWRDRGIAPRGYIKGMALVYARVYCKFQSGDKAALQMAAANSGDPRKDALAWYVQQFHQAGMDNEASGVPTLRHLFVLLIGLGMRESSGRYCEGRDRAASNASANTAEAGLFQTSFNARTASPLLPQLFQKYSTNPSGFLDIFKEGVTCGARDFENFGAGPGRDFQELSKSCPAFASEFAAVGLRTIRSHWGPINRRAAEIRPECSMMLLQVERLVDTSSLCLAVV